MPPPAAVVDIGSNSMRLVVYDGLGRVPLPFYNTKVTARLGHNLADTGVLDPDGVGIALHGLARFKHLVDALACAPVLAVATAAVRRALDGPAFVERAEAALGRPIRVIAGDEEARLSALGVLSVSPEADGVVADLGGASLELAAVGGGRLGGRVSLPLGVLTLMDGPGPDLRKSRRAIDDLLAGVDRLGVVSGRDLHLVGGSFRALARVQMARTDYPLPIVQGFTLPAMAARNMARGLGRFVPWPPPRLPGISVRRSEMVPHAALVLRRLIAHVRPERVVFSAAGLREGVLFDRLDPALRAEDPLLAACAAEAASAGRRSDVGDALLAWTNPLFSDDTPQERRLRRAACRLVDLAWAEHPAFRAEQGLLRVLRAQRLRLPHKDRAFLALVAFHGHGGKASPVADQVVGLAGGAGAARARLLGAALALAGKLTAREPALLAATGLAVEDGRLLLRRFDAGALDEGVATRLQVLAEAAGLGLPSFVIDPA